MNRATAYYMRAGRKYGEFRFIGTENATNAFSDQS